MRDLSFTTPPPRDELLRELRLQLLALQPGLRIVAQGMLGARSTIDFVGVGSDGRLVLALVDDAESDLELIARGLAQRAWVEPRIGDWLQLAPGLGVQPRAGVQLLLLAPRFGAESEAAAEALGSQQPELLRYSCLRNGAGSVVLIEPSAGGPPAAAPRALEPRATEPAARPAQPAAFRTGLSEADLGLTPAERREFE